MEIQTDLLKKLIHGADVTEKDGLIHLNRFTPEQRASYFESSDFTQKTFASSSIRMEFVTDAKAFSMDVIASKGSSRLFYYFDIVVNGALIRCEGAESYLDQPEFHLELPLNGTKSSVCIYFPCLVEIRLKRAAFEGASVIEPVSKKYRMTCFGDSITQGYDTIHPSLAYPNQLADALDAEVFNKGIGGDLFNPALAACPEPQQPDLITVAYGTNDWSRCTKAQLTDNAERFFQNLAEVYPGVPVFAILPIWRKDSNLTTAAGTFEEAREIIRKICEKYPSVQVIDGMTLVPHLDECFMPDGLHPNDFGFQFFGRNLIKQITIACQFFENKKLICCKKV